MGVIVLDIGVHFVRFVKVLKREAVRMSCTRFVLEDEISEAIELAQLSVHSFWIS